jgi:hypothetical protein
MFIMFSIYTSQCIGLLDLCVSFYASACHLCCRGRAGRNSPGIKLPDTLGPAGDGANSLSQVMEQVKLDLGNSHMLPFWVIHS